MERSGKTRKTTPSGKSLEIRVASGRLKGRKLECPPGEIRPMMSMCKQALFNILFGRKEMDMLDLFSGSASISIEGVSRGMVRSADVIEGDYGKKVILNQNVEKMGLVGVVHPIISDAFRYIRSCKKTYDFIMLDPPFKMENKQLLIELLEEKKLLRQGGVIVMHAKTLDPFDNEIGSLTMLDYRKYGINALVFYCYRDDVEEDEELD